MLGFRIYDLLEGKDGCSISSTAPKTKMLTEGWQAGRMKD
jgi:hypothetical protein